MHASDRGDLAIARLAAGQHGVVTRVQLTAAGLGRGAIGHRIAQGRLHRVHLGVYLVGHSVFPPLAREVAALLACGDGAILSHRSAAALWALSVADDEVDVTIVGRGCGVRLGVRVHRMCRLDCRDLTRRKGLPVTSPARTLLDLAEVVSSRELERTLAEAQAQWLVRRPQLEAAIARAPRRRGAAHLRALLEAETGPALTRSHAEERLLGLVRVARLRAPEANVRIGRHEVDLLWRAERLVLEVDGYLFHSSRAAFERDRLRDAELQLAGLRVMRVTWRQIVDEPEALVARLAGALAISR